MHSSGGGGATLLMWKSEKSLEISSDFDLTLIECSLAL